VVASGAAAHPLVAGGGMGARLCGAARCRAARAWRGFSRRHQRACPSQGGGRKRGVTAQALGRSCGGYGTKACAVCDARGRPLGFALIPGQASELRVAPDLLLLAALLGTIRRVICDAAYSSVAWFALVMEAGALPVVRANPTHKRQDHFDRAAYRRRHKVENMWAKLKEWRAIATRYDKTAASFSGGLYLTAAFEWIS
jgi:transposase